MSHLLVKYKENQAAADKLINECKLYAASVHCSYYSCIQLIKYLFLDGRVIGIDIAKFERELARESSHVYLGREMKKELILAGASKKDANTFDFALKQMKLKRKDADYEDIEITENISKQVQNQSIQVINILKSQFSIS